MVKVIRMAPPSADRRATPNGYCLMDVGTHSHVVIGGPFDAFSGGFGVCLEKHSSKVNAADIVVDWPDFGVIDADEFAFLIRRIVEEMLQHPEVPIYIGCRGGIGRTGTVFAGLVRALGIDEANPVAWVREYYLHNAVETGAQKDLIKKFDVSDVRRLVSRPVEEPIRKPSLFERLKSLFPWS